MRANFNLEVGAETLDVHRFMDEGEAVVSFTRDNQQWVVSEDSTYEPFVDVSAHEPSWITVGERSVFNLTRRLGIRHDIEYHGATIQGLVYALAALKDGTDDLDLYIGFIRNELIPDDFEAKSRVLNELEVEGVMYMLEKGTLPELPT
jgi:hypothetical protein